MSAVGKLRISVTYTQTVIQGQRAWTRSNANLNKYLVDSTVSVSVVRDQNEFQERRFPDRDLQWFYGLKAIFWEAFPLLASCGILFINSIIASCAGQQGWLFNRIPCCRSRWLNRPRFLLNSNHMLSKSGDRIGKKNLLRTKDMELNSSIMSCQKLNNVISIIALTGNKLPLLFRPHKKHIATLWELNRTLHLELRSAINSIVSSPFSSSISPRYQKFLVLNAFSGCVRLWFDVLEPTKPFKWFPLLIDRHDLTLATFLLNDFLRSSFDPRPSYIIQWCRCRNRQGKHRIGSIYH